MHAAPAPPVQRIYLAADDHTDYMWTADEETYRQGFLDMIDFYLDQMDATDSLPATWVQVAPADPVDEFIELAVPSRR